MWTIFAVEIKTEVLNHFPLQIATLKAVYDHKNRPVQALNKRFLCMDEEPTVIIDYELLK